MTTDPLAELRARTMNTRQRVAYLHQAGWRRVSYSGAQSWRSPDPSDRAAWTLAAAVRAALANEDPHMTTTIAQADLDAVLAAHPLLTSDGYGDLHRMCPCRNRDERRKHLARERTYLRRALNQVQAAVQWLHPIARNTQATANSPSSYGLKHVMEGQTGAYVTNGEFIAAALILGIPIHHGPGCGPNPGIGLNRVALRRHQTSRTDPPPAAPATA